MIHGSSRCAAVGIRSAVKTAVRPPDSIRISWWCIVCPPVRHDADARQHLAVVLDEVDDPGLGERHEVLGDVARAIPLVRMRRVVPLCRRTKYRARGNAGTSRPSADAVKPPA